MVNNEYKFIFLHVPRTGGTSIESLFQANAPQRKMKSKHTSARYYRRKEKTKWNTYFKFTFVRNPWDRIVSGYEWAKALHTHPHHPRGSFKDWVMNMSETDRKSNLIHPQNWWIHRELDYMGYYESLEENWAEVASILELPNRLHHLPRVFHIPRPHYSHYYDEESRDRIYLLYGSEINLLGYKFEYEK